MKRLIFIPFLFLGCVSKRIYEKDINKCEDARKQESEIFVYLSESLQKQNDDLRNDMAAMEKELKMYRKMYANTMRIQRSVNPLNK